MLSAVSVAVWRGCASAPTRAAKAIFRDPHPGSESLRRFLVIHNPISGGRRGDGLDRAVGALRAGGATVEVVRTEAPGHAEALAAEADGGLDAVVAAGGDGTAHEVANGLLARPSPLPLGVLPLGTANCLARELGLARPPAQAASRLLHAPVRTLHPGAVEIGGRTRHFLAMLGTGFDARVVARLDGRLKRRIGATAYVVDSLRLWARGPVTPVAVSLDGMPAEAGQAVIMNGRYYGGWMRFAPTSTVFRPQLYACLFTATDRPRVLRYCAWSAANRLLRLPDYQVVPARTITVSPTQEAEAEPVQADGEPIGHLPVTIRAATRSLPVLVGDDPQRQRYGPRPVA